MLWAAFAEDWELQHRVVFDGENKLIIIWESTTSVSVKDIYSWWKEWVMIRDNSKYESALRTTGGDPTISGQYAGDLYFLINGWKIFIDHSCVIEGVIYSDDFPTPFSNGVDTNIVTNSVSSLVTVVKPTVTIDGLSVPTTGEISDAVWSAATRTLTSFPSYTGPSIDQIVDGIYEELSASHTSSGTFGLLLNQIKAVSELTNNKVVSMENTINNTSSFVQVLLKYSTNRTQVDSTNKTLTVFDDDNITPIKIFRLLDLAGNPSIDAVYERMPL